jgi:hypothetical protein
LDTREKDWRKLRGLPRDIYGFLRLLSRDRRCCRAADALAGISPWDDAQYWSWLAGRCKMHVVPYVCPWPALLPGVHPRPWAERENAIACLAGTRDPIGRGHVSGFAELARRPELSGWRFLSSEGLMGAAADDMPDQVARLGRIEEPWTLLCGIKAVAVLSPLGYGCKTTVSDALAAGCHVLVHPRQHARLSPEEQALAVAADPGSDSDVRALAERLRLPPRGDAAACGRAQTDRGVAAWKQVLSA